MAASRGHTPPVNLKERIAALQQRSVSPNTHQSAQAVPRGIPSPGSGGLRDKIAKFEEKGGVPVPRGSFAMGAPQLADNAPPKKRGELYANRLPGLGRPSGAPVASRSGSPLPSSGDESPGPGPRKRCISTGAGLSSAPSNFPTDEPVPPLPNRLPASTPRRNSLAINFGSEKRVMNAAEHSPAETCPPLELKTEEEEEDSQSELPPEHALMEPPPSTDSILDASPIDPPAALQNHRAIPIHDASPSSPVEQCSSIKDGLSDYESAPQSAVSESSPSLPEPAPLTPPPDSSDTPSPAPEQAPARTESSLSTSSSSSEAQPDVPSSDSVVAISEPDPSDVAPDGIPPPNPETEPRSRSKPTFKAVVHRKVTELSVAPTAFNLAPPQQTKQRRTVSGNVIDVPPSPGHGDLAILLEDAALLELKLTEGDGLDSRTMDLLAITPTSATFQPDPRHASASTLTDHGPIPHSVDSGGSQSGRSVSIPSIREPLIDGDTPEGDEFDGRSLASTTFSQRSPSHRKYLSNIYRLTSRRSSSYMPGAYPRDSMSMSSEDSSPVTTPSDSGKRKGFGIAWPTASPKKGGPNVSRSGSFADKIFNRNRTKSNVSSAGQASERNSLYQSSQPSLTLPFSSELLPETPPDGLDIVAQPTSSWISPGDSTSEFSPASSFFDKDIFDAFPSVPQTLPPGFHLEAEDENVARSSTLPVSGRKQVNQRLSMA